MFQTVKNLQPIGIVEDDDEHAAVADRYNAPRHFHGVRGLFARGQSGVFVLDLFGRMGFAELREFKWISEALRKFFEPRRAAAKFGAGRDGRVHCSILPRRGSFQSYNASELDHLAPLLCLAGDKSFDFRQASSTSAPRSSASRAFNTGSPRTALIFLLSFSTIMADVFLGVQPDFQETT